MPSDEVLHVGTDLSEAINRIRFYASSGEQVDRGVESPNDLPGSLHLVKEALARAGKIRPAQIRWGMEATNLFWWHLACLLSMHADLVAGGLTLYTFNRRVVAKFKESYEDLGKSDWVDAFVIAGRLRFGRVPAECYLDEPYQPLQRVTRYRRHCVSQLVRENQVALGYVYLKLSAYGLEQPLSTTFRATSQVLLERHLTPDEIVARDRAEDQVRCSAANLQGALPHQDVSSIF
jgi:transposase